MNHKAGVTLLNAIAAAFISAMVPAKGQSPDSIARCQSIAQPERKARCLNSLERQAPDTQTGGRRPEVKTFGDE